MIRYVLFATIYLLYLLHHVPFHRQVCDLPAEELAANDKSRRAIALQHQLIPRYMASWKVLFFLVTWPLGWLLSSLFKASWKAAFS